jgi:SAM-dependent methyltransferase
MSTSTFWNERYAEPGLAYGDRPQVFLEEQAHLLPAGPVLCLAEGQGRNAVFLAGRGHDVLAVDQSAVGLNRARALAAARGVALRTQVADLADFDLGERAWSAVVSIFAHLPAAVRAPLHARVVRALRPGGVFLLVAYTPAQIALGTGGPRDPALLADPATLRAELAGLEWLVTCDETRELAEGEYHRGPSAVIQLVGVRTTDGQGA